MKKKRCTHNFIACEFTFMEKPTGVWTHIEYLVATVLLCTKCGETRKITYTNDDEL